MFAQILLNAVSGAVTAQLVELLHTFRDNNDQQQYEELKASIKNTFTLLARVTPNTKTKLDDTIVKMILEAVEQSDD